jgi:peptide/nickel transport system permease protein
LKVALSGGLLKFLLQRAGSLALTLLVASIVVFAMLEVAPGDPAEFMMGLEADEAALAKLRAEMGLDGTIPERFFGWIGAMLRGDLGISYTYRVPVSELIGERVLVSLPLAIMALVLSTAAALPLGIWSAMKRGSVSDTAIMGAAQIGVAIPNFWFGLILVLIFSSWLGWASAGGFPGWGDGIFPALGALILPAIALALPQAAIMTRVMRSSLLETLDQDFMRTARVKGLSEGQAVRRHGVRNALIPVLTILGLQFSFLLAGGIIIENVFNLPGIGRLVFQAILQRDLIVVKAVVMLLVFVVVVVALLVDLAYAVVDPRVGKGARA